MIRLLFVFVIWTGLFSPVFAQISQQTITNQITANLPTNNNNEINAQLLRNTLNQMTSAIFQAQGLNGLTITNVPAAGQSLVATTSTTANWQNILSNGATCLAGAVNLLSLVIVNGLVVSCGLGPGIALGAGIDFTGKSAGLFVLPANSLNFSSPWTVSFGFKSSGLSSTVNTSIISTNPNTAATGSGFWFLNDVLNTSDLGFTFMGLIRPYVTGTTCVRAPSVCTRASTVFDGNLHWVVWSFDGVNASLYIDGQLKDIFGPSSGYIPSSGVPWQIGATGSFTLTDFRVRTVASSASDVTSLYAYNSKGITPTTGTWLANLAAYWPMSASTIIGQTVADTSGNHNTAQFDTTPPVVVVTIPSSGAVLSGSSVTLTATCTDNVFVSSLTILVDGFPASIGTSSPLTTSFDSTTLLDGSHTISANCTDVAGNIQTTTPVSVTSNNSIAGIDYYISASLGNDSNNGTSTGTPWQTLAKINSASFHAGDKIHMAGGDTWTCSSGTCLVASGPGAQGITQNYNGWPSASLTIDNNFNIGSGTTCAPLAGTITGCFTIDLSGGTATVGVLLSNISNVTLTKGFVKGGASSQFNAGAIGIYMRPAGTTNLYNNTVTAMQVQDMAIGIYAVNPSGIFSINPTITNNWVHGSASNVTLDNGILIQGSPNTNATIATVQGNLIENIGGRAGATPGTTGNPILISNGSTWFIDQFNVTRNSGVNSTTCGGPAGNWVFNGFNIIFQFNEAYGMNWTSGCDGDGFDIDGGAQNIIYQYNYAHGNKGGGFITFMGTGNGAAWMNNTIRYGISENDNTGCGDATCGSLELTSGTGTTGASLVYNMTVWNGANSNGTSRSSAASIQSGCPGPGSYMINNLFATPKDHFNFVNHATLNRLAGGCANNLWKANAWFPVNGGSNQWVNIGGSNIQTTLAAWQAVIPGGDTGANTSDPNFVGTGGTGGTCYSSGVPGGPQPCPTPYALNSGSPDRSTGLDLTQAPYLLNVGTRDYYANSIPGTGPCYNIGAYGVCP